MGSLIVFPLSFTTIFCSLLYYLIEKHILLSFVKNAIHCICIDTVSFCPSCQFLFPSVISQIADEYTEGNASVLDLRFLQ